MGIKIKLKPKDIKHIKKVKSIKPTKDGITHSVFILDDKYILKIFHNSSKQTIKEELKLLQKIKHLKVSKVKYKIYKIKNDFALLYKKCDGKSLTKIKNKHIKQIARFLKQFHKNTKKQSSSNKKLFTKKNLKSLINQTKNKKFKKIFNSIDIKLKNDGVIHGDIFKDNAIFKKDKLSCVIDFCEACKGDFLFDLAVVALSWCKNDKQIKLLLKSYGTSKELKEFKQYICYAALYYSANRYILKSKDYKELLFRCL